MPYKTYFVQLLDWGRWVSGDNFTLHLNIHIQPLAYVKETHEKKTKCNVGLGIDTGLGIYPF